MPQLLTAGASVSLLLPTGATLNLTGTGLAHFKEPGEGKGEREFVLTSGAQSFGPFTADVRFGLLGRGSGLTYDVISNSPAGAASGLVYITGVSGLGNVATANLAAGWTATGWQWYRTVNGVTTAIAGATSASYTQQSADVVPGVIITPRATGLSYAPAGLVADGVPTPIALAISGSPATTGTVGVAYSAQITASGGTAPYSFSLASGSLPAGLSLNASTGLISGTPSSAGTSAGIVVQVQDAAGATAALAAFAIVVSAAQVVAPVNTAVPVINDTTPTVGDVLSTTNGSWNNSPTGYTYQWKRAGANISGATGSTYTVVSADIGNALSVTVTATNSAGSASATSAATSAAVAAPADSRARFGVGSATAGVTDAANLLAAMTPMTGSANGSKAGSFSVSPAAGQYGWAAFEAGASSAGVTFTDPLGTGGWQGASSSGNNGADDGSSPNTSTVTAVINGVTWRFFRQSYGGAAGTFTTT